MPSAQGCSTCASRSDRWVQCFESRACSEHVAHAALGGIGRLLLAAHGNYGLAYAGSVGIGFTHASATALRRQLDQIKATVPPARGVSKKGVVWVKPKLAAEIAYRGWTHDEKLRHASFKGLREKADVTEIYRLG